MLPAPPEPLVLIALTMVRKPLTVTSNFPWLVNSIRFVLILAVCVRAHGVSTFQPASGVQWSGRTVLGSAPGSISFDWLGVSCRVSVRGATMVSVVATSNGTVGTRMRAYTSDQGFGLYPASVFWVSARAPSNQTLLYVGDNATLGDRTITLEHMGGEGTTTMHGFITDGTFVTDPDPLPTGRRIEFIGDSITAATNLVRPAGAPSCRGDIYQLDWSQSYAAQICHKFRASCSTIAVGGKCMMRECGGLQMPDYYNAATVASAPATTWDFQAGWHPDAVFIDLGTNDERAIHGHPGANESFAEQTIAFLHSVVRRYSVPDTAIKFFLAAGPIRNFTSYASRAVPVVVARANAQGLDATFVDLTGACAVARLHSPDNSDLCDGCSAHPGVEGHYEMFRKASPVIAAKMGW